MLELIPAQAQALVYYRDFRGLEAKWSKVAGHFGEKGDLLSLKTETGIDPTRLGAGPVVRVSMKAAGAAETAVWLLPAKQPKALLEGLKATQKAGVWTWTAPAGRTKKGQPKAAPTALFASAWAGHLIVADTETDLAAFKKPILTLAAELAPYAAWLEGHDVSLVATQAAIEEAARSASQSFKPAAVKAGEAEKPTSPASKVVSRFQAKFDRWAELAKTIVHHALAGLDLSGDGGVAFVAQALITRDSPLSQELAALPPVAGHPLGGLAPLEFALALGGDWTALFDFQSALMEDLGKGGKVQPATLARLQEVSEKQSALIRSIAGLFSAPAPRGALMSGMTSLVRVTDSKAYLAAMEESAKAQSALLQDLGMAEAVTVTRDLLPGVPSFGSTTRLDLKKEDPATASSRMAMAMIFGGESIQMSLGALDDHRVLMVMGGPELLKTRLEELGKAPEGLARSIAAIEPDLGRDHRFALYLDPQGMRDMAQVLAGMFGGSGPVTLPAIPAVPAAGITLSLTPTTMELRGSVRAETLKATATLIKAIGALIPANKKAGGAEAH